MTLFYREKDGRDRALISLIWLKLTSSVEIEKKVRYIYRRFKVHVWISRLTDAVPQHIRDDLSHCKENI